MWLAHVWIVDVIRGSGDSFPVAVDTDGNGRMDFKKTKGGESTCGARIIIAGEGPWLWKKEETVCLVPMLHLH